MSIRVKASSLDPAEFRAVCHRHGLAATHQREVIYKALMEHPGHPSPEDVYAVVHKTLPSMSLATVYKTFHAFVDAGLLKEVNLHRGALRVDPNPDPHHHLVCTNCRTVEDLETHAIEPVRIKGKLPQGFVAQRYSVEVQGLCRQCADLNSSSKKL